MDNIKINMTFECLTWRQPIISHIITKCIETTLGAENITVQVNKIAFFKGFARGLLDK